MDYLEGAIRSIWLLACVYIACRWGSAAIFRSYFEARHRMYVRIMMAERSHQHQ